MVDILNAFIKTRVQQKEDMDIINIIGIIADILLEIDPDIYEPYVTTYRKGLQQLVLQCHNATNRKMMAILL